MRRLIHAKLVLDRVSDQRLGIDGAVQVAVQVGAFRHAFEEDLQSQRVAAESVELLACAKLSLAPLPLRDGERRQGQNREQGQRGSDVA